MENIKQINNQFDILKTLRSDILTLFNEITDNISKVNKIYIDVVKTHHHKEHLFGLDAFLFQNKMFENYQSVNGLPQVIYKSMISQDLLEEILTYYRAKEST